MPEKPQHGTWAAGGKEKMLEGLEEQKGTLKYNMGTHINLSLDHESHMCGTQYNIAKTEITNWNMNSISLKIKPSL